jgi:chromosome segregation ATPase
MTSITVQEFDRVQKEVQQIKWENHHLREEIAKVTTASQGIFQSLFSSAEKTEIDRLEHEEADLKKSIQTLQERNDALREQCRQFNTSESLTTQIATLDSLFKTKKRELTRMHELNATTITDLEEEVELAQGLCDSLESGRSSLSRDKEALENTILSLQAARQSIDSRVRDLEQLNQQLRADLGVKAVDGSESTDISFQYEDATHKLKLLEAEFADITKRFDADEERLQQIEAAERRECETLDQQYQAQTAQVEEQLRTLRHELQSLKSRNPSDETVEIDVDSLIRENAELQVRIDNLERRRLELAETVNDNQIDCCFLGQWMKKEQNSHSDAETAFRDLIQKECDAKEELKALS